MGRNDYSSNLLEKENTAIVLACEYLFGAMEKGGVLFSMLKARHLKRMGNISEFEKILKQGFSVWYNNHHKKRGTLWMERILSAYAHLIFWQTPKK